MKSPKTGKRRSLFNLFGGAVVLLWLLLMGLLIKQVHFPDNPNKDGFVSASVTAVETPQRDWMEIYQDDKKVGYSVNQISPLGEDYLIREEILLKLNLMGQATDLHALTHCVVDPSFVLKTLRFRMTSGVVTFQVSGTVEGEGMRLEIGTGPSRRTERISLAQPPVLGAGMPHFFKGRHLGVGQSFQFSLFDPSTLAQKEIVMRVTGREALVIRRLRYNAFRLETEMWGQAMTFWLDEKGAVLKEKGFMGLTLIKSSVTDAPRGIGGAEGKDFYDLAAIKVAKRLRQSKRLTYLKLKAEGFEKTRFDTAILNKGRQRFRNNLLEITKEQWPKKVPYRLPYPDPLGEMRPFLQPEINIQSDAAAIVEKARQIARNSSNPAFVARRLMDWLYENIKKKPVVSVPSATEVLKSQVGDCNEHAVLLTAFLRALGIPARICVGLVYTRRGFYYHAWTEAYLGEWVSMDPTLNQMPVDASHIKLVEGGLERQVQIVALIGKLKFEVSDFSYD